MGCRNFVASVAESQIEIAEGFVSSVKRGSPIMKKRLIEQWISQVSMKGSPSSLFADK